MRRSCLILVATLCGCTGETSVLVYNAPPTAAILSPVDGTSVDENEGITFEGRVSDDSGVDALVIQWTSDKDGLLTDTAMADPDGWVEYSTANLKPGNHLISLRSVDSDGEQGVASIAITVIDLPEPPDVELISPAQGEEGIEDELFTFEASVSDAQDGPEDMEVVFLSDKQGFLCEAEINGLGGATCEAALPAGTHLITVEAIDSDDFRDEDTAYMKVTALGDLDQDEDGWTPNQGDCNDKNETVFPGAEELPNEVDDDCDGDIDEGTINYDDDGDGYSEVDGDCDDTNRLTYPGAKEVEDMEDNDCDGTIDEGTLAYDDDKDGYTEHAGDCNDADPKINPGATEVCDRKDNDCDTKVDEEGASGCSTFYRDNDKDGYGDPKASKCLCSTESTYTSTNKNDCYDNNGSAKPGQTSYFGSNRGDGSWDFNCDGAQSKNRSAEFKCSGAVWVCASHTDGWLGSVASCGVTGTWATDCSGTFTGCDPTGKRSIQQTCR
ncbi:MAG: hypothetical protein ACI9MC_000089 [Kiritimatiellia bacterium]|jgi:hypothetical protein